RHTRGGVHRIAGKASPLGGVRRSERRNERAARKKRFAVLEPLMRAKFALAFVLLGVVGLCQYAQQPTPVIFAAELKAKKLISFGWGSPDTQYVRDHWQQIEEMPFDGVGIVVPVDRRAWQQGQRHTGNQLGWQIMGKKAFHPEDFRVATEDLKAAKWRKLTDNFLPVFLSAAQSTIG